MKVYAVYAYDDGLLAVFKSREGAECYKSDITFDYGVDGESSEDEARVYFVEDVIIEEAELY